MGAHASRPAYVLKVRLAFIQRETRREERDDFDPSTVFARIHSGADGIANYKNWGETQEIGILSDDVLSISVHIAKDEAHFAKNRCDDFAQVCVPWILVRDAVLPEGTECAQEASLNLALLSEQPWLAFDAPPISYVQNFERSLKEAREGSPKHMLHLVLSLAARSTEAADGTLGAAPTQMVDHSKEDKIDGKLPGLHSPAIAYGVEELSPEDMKLLLKLQVRNQALRDAAGVRGDIDLPEVDEQVQSHLRSLNRALMENYASKAEVQNADRILAETSAKLDENQRAALWGSGAETNFSAPGVDDQSSAERAAFLSSEIQKATSENSQLIVRTEEYIKGLEMQLASARQVQPANEWKLKLDQQLEELQAIDAECERLQTAIDEEKAKKSDSDKRLLQKLQLEHEVQLEEIKSLRHSINRKPSEGFGLPPGTAILQDEFGRLQSELAFVQQQHLNDQEAVEAVTTELRLEIQHLQQQSDDISRDSSRVQRELEELLGNRTGAHGSSKGEAELVQTKSKLESEISRTHRRIEILDEKVKQMQEETDDLRRRANLVHTRSNNEVGFGTNSPHVAPQQSMQASALHEMVRDLMEQTALAARSEQALMKEQEQARQELKIAEMDATVLEQRMELLRDRSRPSNGSSS